MNKSHIIDGVRSPIGVKNGQIVGLRPDDLAAQVVKSLLKRNSIEPNLIEDVIVGCAYPEVSTYQRNSGVPILIKLLLQSLLKRLFIAHLLPLHGRYKPALVLCH